MTDTSLDILKISTNWAKAEMLSSAVFILIGVIFLLASFGFWHLGKTDVARAYIVPGIVAGLLLAIIGLGIFFPAMARVTGFVDAYGADPAAFIADQKARADAVLGQYKIAVFRVIPLIIAVAALLIPVMQGPIWRASLITIIAMMAVILIIDTNANARLEAYRAALERAVNQP